MIQESPFARFVGEALGKTAFTLLDIGSDVIQSSWGVFGAHLRGLAIGSGRQKVLEDRLTYIDASIAVTGEDIAGSRLSRNPWSRLSVARTLSISNPAPTVPETGLAKTPEVQVVRVPEVVNQNAIRADIDFIRLCAGQADFEILRALALILDDANVLGVSITVNFFGSGEPQVHTFHNVDRFMKDHGFELFVLAPRMYSVGALPAPYVYPFPANTIFGRVLQGDAVYFRDAVAPENIAWTLPAGSHKLVKLAALFSMFGLPDCAAEVVVRLRPAVDEVLDVARGLDLLVLQTGLAVDDPSCSYEHYMTMFDEGNAMFYPSKARVSSNESESPSIRSLWLRILRRNR